MAWPWGGPWPPYNAPMMTRGQELDMLKGQTEYFEDAPDSIWKHIGELESQASEAAT
jgi:hypothetical protein